MFRKTINRIITLPISGTERAFAQQQKHVVVVGAGVAGMNTCYYLHKEDPNLKITLIDRHMDPGQECSR